MAEFSIKSASTGQTIYTGTMKYVGTYLKPGYCEFAEIGSPTKIDWNVGDYVDYPRTGRRYTLRNIPQQAKQATAQKYGAAFLYENVQFFDATKDLEMPFIDIVPDDNEGSFSTLNTVAFTGTPENVAERVEACLNYWLPNGNWEVRVISGLSPLTDAELIETLATEADFNVSGATCQEALEKMYDIWNGLGWSYKVESNKNVLVIGDPNKRTSANTTDEFSYGNGLTHLKKSTGNADEIGTRLYAYGSMKNMMGNYYRGKGIKDAESVDIEHLMLPIGPIASLSYAGWGKTNNVPDARKAFIENATAIGKLGLIPKYAYFDGTDENYPEIYPSIEGVTIGDVIDAKASGSDKYKCGICGYVYDPEAGDPEGGIAPGTKFEDLPADWVCPTCGAEKDEFEIPDDPSLDHYSRSDRVDEVLIGDGLTDDGTVAPNGQRYTQNVKINTDAATLTNIGGSDPFSVEIASFPLYASATASADIKLDLSGTVDISNGVIGELNLSAVVSSEGESVDFPITLIPTSTSGRYSFTLNGNTSGAKFVNGIGYLTVSVVAIRGGYATIDFSASISAGTLSVGISEGIPETFTIRIPQIGFDIDEYAELGNGKTISFKSGLCAGRDFKIKSTRYLSASDSWELTCSRSKDADMGVWFPNVESSIEAGDRFVLLDIAMPELYITIASIRLLKAAKKLLADIDHEKPYYEPEIDAKKVDDEARVIREGMYMHLVTDEIVDGLDDYAIIDNLEIEEDGLIPTFTVKLRKKKAVTWTENISKGDSSKSSTEADQSNDYLTREKGDKIYQPKGDYPTRREIDNYFEKYTLPNNGGIAIKLKDSYVGMFATGWVSSGGISTTGGGGGGSVNALRDWANYRPDDTTQVLGSNLGKGLKDDITTLQGYFTNGVANSAAEANTLDGHSSTYFAHQVKLGTVEYNATNGIVSLPAYPTTLPASDVYAWAKKAALDVNDIPSITTGKISDLETWIANKGFVTKAVNDLANYYTKQEVDAQTLALSHGIAANSARIQSIEDLLREDEWNDYINGVVAYGSGNYITGFSKSGNTLTLSFGTLASWALSANKPSYNFSEIGSKPTTLAGYGITDAYFMPRTADADKVGIVLGITVENVLIKHQSLAGYVNAITCSYESDVYECPDCDYVYNPAIGDPSSGIAPGTSYDDLPEDWVCPVCGASKEVFSEGAQFVYGVYKSHEASTISFAHKRIRLKNIDGVDDLKAIEALTGTSGLLRKTGSNTWSLDTTQYITKDVNNLTNYYTKTEVDARVFFEEYTLPNNGGTAIKLKDAYVGMFASGFVSSGGISTAGGGGGTTVNALRDWANYRADDTTQVLGSNLGKGLKDSIETLQGYFTNGVVNNAADSDTLDGHASTYYAHQVNLGSTIYAASNGIVSLPAYPTNYYTKSESDAQTLVLSQGIAANSARLQSIEDWLREEEWNYVDRITLDGVTYLPRNGKIALPDYPTTLPASDVYAWAKKASLDVNDIPSITTGKISDLETWIADKGFVTRAVDNLANYYLKSQTYTQSEVNALIAAINQISYEIAASTSAVVNPQSNVLYLIGPIGSGSDKYEEYVYPNSTTGWTKIGDTSIDLTGYVNGINYGHIAETPVGFVSGVSKASGSGTIVFDFTSIYAWALASTKPSYTFSEIGSKPTTIVGYGISDVYFGAYTTGSDNIQITLGSETHSVLTAHQSLANYYTKDQTYTKTEVDARVFFEEYTLPNNGGTAIKLKDAYVGMFASGFVSSGGISTTGGGGGTTVNALRDWENYRADDTTQVLGSNLGKGLKDDITTLQGYFTNGVADYADDANTLGGHASTYFAHTVRLGSTDYSASNGLINIPSITTGVISDLETWIASKGFVTKTVNDLTNYYTKPEVDSQTLALSQGIAANSARLQSIEDWIREDDASTYAHQVNLGSTIYAVSNGIVSLPAYPTTLPASDVYPWAKASTKPSYTFSEIGSKPTTLLGYGITDAHFVQRTADADKVGIVLGITVEDVLIKHQSLTNYYTKSEVDEQALALSQGIASNSARLQSIEDSLRDDEWNDDFDWAFISASQTHDTTDIIIP